MRAYLFAMLISIFAATALSAETNAPAIIPAPQKMEVTRGQFRLVPVTLIAVDEASAVTGQHLAAKLRASTGYPFPVYTNNDPTKATIRLTTKGAKAELGPEGYELAVGVDGVDITAPTQAGLFYGVQTLLQLFPPQIF